MGQSGPVEFTSADGESRYAAVVRAADRLVVGLDFDGTLAPIVDDPDQARIHPDGPAVLVDLADAVAGVAVITGRPARQVLDLGGLDEVGDQFRARGRGLQVLGQYGNERWSSEDGRVVSPTPPEGLALLVSELPRLLHRCDADQAWVEEKGLAVGIHTRRLADAQAAYDRLLEPVTQAARAHGLVVEPGRMVIEVRAPGMDKGQAVRRVVRELGAQGVVFVGDDLGDVEAFRALRDLAAEGSATLSVCSDSGEQPGLSELTDVVVDGVDGVLDFLRGLVTDIRRSRD